MSVLFLLTKLSQYEALAQGQVFTSSLVDVCGGLCCLLMSFSRFQKCLKGAGTGSALQHGSPVSLLTAFALQKVLGSGVMAEKV